MKTIRGLFLGGLVLAASLHFVQAQQAASFSAAAQPVSESADDLSLVLQALEQTTPQPASATPDAGFFYTFQHAPGSTNAWPPLPGNVLNLPFWSIGDGFYVLDDRDVDYAELQAEAEAMAELESALTPEMDMLASSLASSSAYGNPVYLANLTASFTNDGGMMVNFSIVGGTNLVPYDILMTTNLVLPVSQWTWLGIGYTSNNYTFSNQPVDNAFYLLAKPSHTQVVGLGDDTYQQCDVPAGLTNAVQVAGGYAQGLALLNDGTICSWGDNYFTSPPTNLTGVTMIACGWNHNVALLTNGTVTAWGLDGSSLGWNLTEVPADLTNVTVISAQALHTLALKGDGTVAAWGYNGGGETNLPAGLAGVTAIAAGGQFNLAVSNGCVVAWGYGGSGQCNVPANLSNVVDVAAGWNHSVALKSDGTVICWGDDHAGQCDVPAGLSNVVAIAAGGFGASGYTLALQGDGTLLMWGAGKAVAGVRSLDQVVAIGGGCFHALALRTGSRSPVLTVQPVDQYQLAGGNVTFTARGEGLYGVSYQWQTNGVNLSGATNASLTVTNVQLTSATNYDVVVTDNGGMGSLASAVANLFVITPPVILSQSPMPTNQVGIYQSNLILSVSASAPGQYNGFPLHYQWQFNGANISGATSSNYTFSAVNPGTYSVTVTNTAGSANAAWSVTISYVGSYIDVGTLAYHLSTNAVGRTNGISNIYNAIQPLSGWNYIYYSGTNFALLTNAVWSTNFWLHGVQGLNATPIGISNNTGAQTLITMISPRHYLRAHHTGIPSGIIAFLDTNNVVFLRSCVQQVDIGTNADDIQAKDTSVGILDADLPPSVGFLPVIPTNFASYLPTNNTSYVQGIGMNQDPTIFGQPMTFGDPLNVDWDPTKTAPFGLGTAWNVNIRPGDSSNPEMFLIGNQLVLVSHNHTSEYGPNYAYLTDAINQQMHYLTTNNAVGTNYQMTPFSLTNWPTIH